jgi:hypothetical protein
MMDKESYDILVDKIGSSTDNILVINNFLTEEECDLIVNNLNTKTALSLTGFWENRIFSEFSFPKECKSILKKYRIKSHAQVKKIYGDTLLANSMNQHIVKWPEGPGMEEHIDDEAKERSHYHIASVLYLNDNYDGGEINFPQHNLSIKPKKGDLLIFPGNQNYAHEVKEILSGERFTAPGWYRFL